MRRIFASLLPAVIISPWVACPLAAQPVIVGKFPAKIVPEQASILSLPEKGIVTDLADPGQRLEKGAVVAILNKQRTEEEREDMEMQLARERLSKREEVQKLRAERRKAEFYLSLSEEQRRYNTDFQESGQTPSRGTISDIDERLDLINRELDTLERRKHSEFNLKHDGLTLRMPFAGKLQYGVSIPEDRSQPIEVAPSSLQSFATVCDDSAFYITIAIADSNLTVLPEQNFSVYISLPGGRRLAGTYARRRVERASSNSDLLVYYFRLPETDHDTAFKMLGSNSTATLIYESASEALLVSKAELVAHPVARECEDWQQLVARTHPGCHILLVGDRYIVLTQDTASAKES